MNPRRICFEIQHAVVHFSFFQIVEPVQIKWLQVMFFQVFLNTSASACGFWRLWNMWVIIFTRGSWIRCSQTCFTDELSLVEGLPKRRYFTFLPVELASVPSRLKLDSSRCIIVIYGILQYILVSVTNSCMKTCFAMKGFHIHIIVVPHTSCGQTWVKADLIKCVTFLWFYWVSKLCLESFCCSLCSVLLYSEFE